jgi:glyoxylase-like metal-dependent hydrolase (beta-lactamase superfamily II)
MRVILALLSVMLIFGTAAPRAAEFPASGDIAKRGLSKADFPRWKELSPNIYAYEGLEFPDTAEIVVTTVSLIVVTKEGVVVVDGQGDLRQTQEMIDVIKKWTPQPIRYVVIASDHIDHVGGNAAFKAAYPDVVFVSSPVSQRNLAKNANPPTETVAEKRVITLGGTDIQILNIGRGHTGGDLVAYLPASKVLFMGELYMRHIFPALRSGYPSEWLATIKRAQAMDVSWYIPGHGFTDDMASMRADLEGYRVALEYVIAEGKRLYALGAPCPNTGKPPSCEALKQANWGPYLGWAWDENQARLAISKVYQEIEGKLPQ